MRIVEVGVERVDDLEHLWKALQAHHAEVMPNAGGLMPRDLDQTWQMRRRKYLLLLSEPDGFALIAEEQGRLLGYAMVRISEGSLGYVTASRIGDVETLSVSPEARGQGVGGALMDEVDERLAAKGVHEVRLAVVAGNESAMRFYQRRGLVPFAVSLIGQVRTD
jgi:ribosomal protein S18 acetylase RimI-like enzyme